MNEDEIELLKEKMCTKICQLTRVVYLLNNKYLDSQAMITAIQNSYETEIQNISREANEVIAKSKKTIESLKSTTQYEDKLKIIKTEYEEKFQNLQKNWENFQKESLEKEKKITFEYQEKYNSMVEELNKLKKMTKEKIKDFNKKCNDEINDKNKYLKEIENITKKKNRN